MYRVTAVEIADPDEAFSLVEAPVARTLVSPAPDGGSVLPWRLIRWPLGEARLNGTSPGATPGCSCDRSLAVDLFDMADGGAACDPSKSEHGRLPTWNYLGFRLDRTARPPTTPGLSRTSSRQMIWVCSVP